MQSRGWKEDKLYSELGDRGKILEYMRGKGMRDYISVSLVVQAYSVNPEQVLGAIKSDTLQEMISQHL